MKNNKRNDDGFLDPDREKHKLWAGIAALVGLVVVFIILLIGAFTGVI